MLDPLSKIAVIHGLRHALSTRTARRTRSTPPLNGYDYPGRFSGLLHARGWLAGFFGWANDEHHHSGLALFTPADVFFGRVAIVAATRQAALDTAYATHPRRFPNGPPRVALPPAAVHINPLTADALLPLQDEPTTNHASLGCKPRRPLAATRRPTWIDARRLDHNIEFASPLSQPR